MGKKPPQPLDKYIVRLPDGMRDRIAASAKENKRSMNAEIVARLEYSFLEDPEKYMSDKLSSTLELIRQSNDLLGINLHILGGYLQDAKDKNLMKPRAKKGSA